MRFNIDLQSSPLKLETIFNYTLTSMLTFQTIQIEIFYIFLCKPNYSRNFYQLSIQVKFLYIPCGNIKVCESQKFSKKKKMCPKVAAFASFGYFGNFINNCEYKRYKRKQSQSPLYFNIKHSSLLKNSQTSDYCISISVLKACALWQ